MTNIANAKPRSQRSRTRRAVSWLAPLGGGMILLGAVPAGATSARTVLVLSVAEEGHQQDALRTQVGELVQRAGAQPINPSGLSAATRACEEPSCLRKLADEHRVELILAARITHHSRHDRLIDMWIYDIKSQRDQSGRELCDAREMKDCLTTLAGKLIGPQIEGTAPQESPPTASATEQEPAPSPLVIAVRKSPPPAAVGTDGPYRAVRSSLPTWRLGVGAGLAALATGTLITAVTANAMHGQKVPGSTCLPMGSVTDCGYQLTSVFAPSYAVAGIAAVGAVLSFALPTPRSARKEKL